MSDRLDELRRQRQLLCDHLAWLECEIAAEETRGQPQSPRGFANNLTTAPSVGPATPSVRPPSGATAAPAATTAGRTTDPDSILEQYRQPAGSLQQDVRRGCLLYFFVALALVGFGVMILYMLISA